MAYDYSELVAKTKSWAQQAHAIGWIDDDTAEKLQSIDHRTPDNLLGNQASRPLIVAFMGGTGVGKSSLLNRLAAAEIAKTGVERPTSREVTLYHHKAIQIHSLPDDLPISGIRLAQHENAARKNIIWIDMPDFDSTEQHNKEIVLQWLPHIDILLYVVSPERYRDNKAWRLLLAEGGRHAWIFVLNQWDRGQNVQYDDFKKQLGLAGFKDPVIFKTVCGEPYPDEFSQLAETIENLATENTVKHLKVRNTRVRKLELKNKLENCCNQVGQDSVFDELIELWQEQWDGITKALMEGFDWPLQQLSSFYANHDKAPRSDKLELWDHWAQSRFEDGLDNILIQADAQRIATTPLKNQLAPIRIKPVKIIADQTELGVRQALANPGNALHRFFLKLMRIFEFILPLVAMSWVGYQVFYGYYHSSVTYEHYLGVDFAIHSTLLIALSWLIPFFIHRKLKPSIEKAALKGLKKGLDNAFALLGAEVSQSIQQTKELKNKTFEPLALIMSQCSDVEEVLLEQEDKKLARMLID